MNPQEKATELFNKFCFLLMNTLPPGQRQHAETIRGYEALGKLISDSVVHIQEQAKKCAIQCADELIEISDPMDYDCGIPQREYFVRVKSELEKL